MYQPSDDSLNETASVQNAVKDLMMLEQVHVEADACKALGNKFMASKDYEKALDQYSAALRLSPVGPNSHVFLSNRAAALLSLRKFREAAVDARRAIQLHSTFGKAHARLGQALYYQKDFEGAIQAYQRAVQYDPDNAVSLAYMQKAKAKLVQKQEKNRHNNGGTPVEADVQTVGSHRTTNSVLSHWHPPGNDEKGLQESQRKQQHHISPQALPGINTFSPIQTENNIEQEQYPRKSPESELIDKIRNNQNEAERLHRRGNKRFHRKEFELAIEEFSAAIWLCPDDSEFSPKYYLSRASAYFHTEEYLLAKEDCEKALHLYHDEPKAYILLGKSLFKLEAFHECIDVMEYGFELLADHGGTPSSFDQVYLTKAQVAVNTPENYNPAPQVEKASRHVPKLPPPRFVSREEAIQSAAGVPSLPSSWPVQSLGETTLKVGPERSVIFGEGPMGVKLNRGPDGVVRVLSLTHFQQQNILEGNIYVGDVVREMAKVDLRRPVTNIMWGDTVALIRMSPRPVTLVVAKELSEPPRGTTIEMTKQASEELEQNIINEPVKYQIKKQQSVSGGKGAYQRRLAERQAKLSAY